MEGGYRVTSKPLRERNGGHVEKGVDVELATELIARGFDDSYEVTVVVTGDADFTRAIRYVQDRRKAVVGATFEASASRDLKGTVDEFVDLTATPRGSDGTDSWVWTTGGDVRIL